MKRYILISAMLVAAIGVNAQRTNTGTRPATTTTRSVEEEKKSTPDNTETRTREAQPVRQNTNNESRQESPARTAPSERKTEPAYNESRNRETPAVRPTSNTRVIEAPSNESRPIERNVENRKVTTVPENNQEKPRTTVRETERKATGTTVPRESAKPQSGDRPVVNREVNVDRNREVNVDRNREYVPRTEHVYVEKRQAYRTPERPRTVRTVNQHTNYVYHPVEYRKSYYPYAEPRRVEIIWDYDMYNEYRYLYPHYDYWYYSYGYRIQTVSAYDAGMMIGEVARIYGKVADVWYERNTDEYTLYFGDPYPYQDFSIILSGKFARRYSYRPERYFINRTVVATGLVSLWDERPELLIKKRSQLEVYL